MTQRISSTVSVNGFSNHDDLERLCLLFAQSILDRINDEGLTDVQVEELYYEPEILCDVCCDYSKGDISDEEALWVVGKELQKLIRRSQFIHDTAYLTIEVSSSDDVLANEELLHAFCQFLIQFSDDDHYFEHRTSYDRTTTVRSFLIHMKDERTGTWSTSNSEIMLSRLLALRTWDKAGKTLEALEALA